MPNRLIYYTRVQTVERKKKIVRGWKDKDGNGHCEEADLGWFVGCEGSWELLSVGDVRPAFEVGDRLRVTLEVIDG